MSLAESPAPLPGAIAGPSAGALAGARSGPSTDGLPAANAAAARIPANHLMDSVLPVREALVDRGSSVRTKPGMVQSVLESGNALAMMVCGREALVQQNRLVLLDAAALSLRLHEEGVEPQYMIYLGSALPGSDISAGTELILFVLSDTLAPGSAGTPGTATWAGFRDVAAQLDALHTALFVEASAIANWHATHTHCPRCGAGTVVEAGGWVRRCPADNSEHYPRTDPAIIVTVVGKDGRLLLGGGGPVDAKNYSTLAGFVEPGESLEQAVVREIHEEVGIRVTACQYLGSQPWPFPASLMLGFTASTSDADPRPDGVEVTRARWFSREELQEAVLRGDIVISSRLSIARALIEHWYGGVIQDRPADS